MPRRLGCQFDENSEDDILGDEGRPCEATLVETLAGSLRSLLL
jgi:hypothetical protein